MAERNRQLSVKVKLSDFKVNKPSECMKVSLKNNIFTFTKVDRVKYQKSSLTGMKWNIMTVEEIWSKFMKRLQFYVINYQYLQPLQNDSFDSIGFYFLKIIESY